MEDPENFEKGYYGRLSPFAKEQLYREYHKGMSVKDLSLKYGILHQRVKAIIFQKHLYWEEVYPKLGESHMRLALEREALYASEFPFVEYGCDLQAMAELEKGIRVERLSRTEYDSNPPKETEEKVNKYIYKMRSRKSDRIPLELQGKSCNAYLLQEWVIHRGKGAPRTSRLFADIARHYGRKETEHFLNTKTRRRMAKGGIRYASLGKKHSS
jgi:hypothetical protein